MANKIVKKENQQITEKRIKIMSGRVVSNKMTGTAVILVERKKLHPIYKKKFTVSKKYFVNDPENTLNINDEVKIKECRPLSKNKRWEIVK